MATQRVSVDVISGTAKNNFNTRISFKVPAGVDSKIILDETGAEDLAGKGDLLINNNSNISRAQGVFISTSDEKKIIDFIIKNNELE